MLLSALCGCTPECPAEFASGDNYLHSAFMHLIDVDAFRGLCLLQASHSKDSSGFEKLQDASNEEILEYCGLDVNLEASAPDNLHVKDGKEPGLEALFLRPNNDYLSSRMKSRFKRSSMVSSKSLLTEPFNTTTKRHSRIPGPCRSPRTLRV